MTAKNSGREEAGGPEDPWPPPQPRPQASASRGGGPPGGMAGHAEHHPVPPPVASSGATGTGGSRPMEANAYPVEMGRIRQTAKRYLFS